MVRARRAVQAVAAAVILSGTVMGATSAHAANPGPIPPTPPTRTLDGPGPIPPFAPATAHDVPGPLWLFVPQGLDGPSPWPPFAAVSGS